MYSTKLLGRLSFELKLRVLCLCLSSFILFLNASATAKWITSMCVDMHAARTVETLVTLEKSSAFNSTTSMEQLSRMFRYKRECSGTSLTRKKIALWPRFKFLIFIRISRVKCWFLQSSPNIRELASGVRRYFLITARRASMFSRLLMWFWRRWIENPHDKVGRKACSFPWRATRLSEEVSTNE